jgi:hypothetical protein
MAELMPLHEAVTMPFGISGLMVNGDPKLRIEKKVFLCLFTQIKNQINLGSVA